MANIKSFKPPASDPTLPSAGLWRRVTDLLYYWSNLSAVPPLYVQKNAGAPSLFLAPTQLPVATPLRLSDYADGDGLYLGYVRRVRNFDQSTNVAELDYDIDHEAVLIVNDAERFLVNGENGYMGHALMPGGIGDVDSIYWGFATGEMSQDDPAMALYVINALDEGCGEGG